MFNRKDLVMLWSDGMPRILIIAHLSSMTQATTDKSMHTTKTSQTHTEAPSMTPSMFFSFFEVANKIEILEMVFQREIWSLIQRTISKDMDTWIPMSM